MNIAVRPPRAPRNADRVLTGAAAGWANRWGVEPTVLRAALGVLGLAGGIGVVLYALAVAYSDPVDSHGERDVTTDRHDSRRDLAVGSATAAALLATRSVGLWPGDGTMVAAVAVAIGVAVVWSPGPRFTTGLPGVWLQRPLLRRITQTVVGVVLLGAGVVSLANRTGGLSNIGASASAIAVVVGGLAVFGAPALGRLLHALDDERSKHIREEEMERVSAHLHDSVLQSLVLIQRSRNPREMASLARRQERELRAWLYGDVVPGEPTTVATAVETLTTAIESDHHVRVESVVVGDQPLDEAGSTLLAALREAVVNAARHAHVDRIDVFVEADVAELTGFVRDTGIGFDPDGAVIRGHNGIRDSIVGRVRRVGGAAVIDSHPGVGTEVEISVPQRQA